jgi:glutaredoxin
MAKTHKFDCPICGKEHEVDTKKFAMDLDYSVVFCEKHSSEEMENWIQEQIEGSNDG